jgi:hypothetical protein
MAKVGKREIEQNEAARREREGTAGLEQCDGCPAGGLYRPDPARMIDGCSRHSTASYYATSGDSGMGGGNLPVD